MSESQGKMKIPSWQPTISAKTDSLLTPRPFPLPVSSAPQVQASEDLTGYRKPQDGDMIENVRRYQQVGTTSQETEPTGINGRQLIAPAPPSMSYRIQPKLTIGEPGDRYEQEADQVASDVLQRINAPASVQRRELRVPPISSQASPQDRFAQGKLKPQILRQKDSGGGEATTELESSINSARGGGLPLDAGLQQSMGRAMGADFSGVRVHTDSQADRLNQSIQAKAFTTGQDVFFRQGEYDPSSSGGLELIAHELTHVVQQTGVIRRETQEEIETREATRNRVKESMRGLNLPERATATSGVHYAKDYRDRARLYQADPVTNARFAEYAANLDKCDDNGYANPQYFDRLAPMDWQLKPGMKASEGIRVWLSGLTIAECFTAVMAIQYEALCQAIGDDKFNELYSTSGQSWIPQWIRRLTTPRLRISRDHPNETQLREVLGSPVGSRGEVGNGDEVGDRHVIEGVWYYFYNHPQYLRKHREGEWQGINVICTSNEPTRNKWQGLGTGEEMSEPDLLSRLQQEYNKPRTEEDYARILREHKISETGIGAPATNHEKYIRNIAQIPVDSRMVDGEGGRVPVEITVEDLTTAPEFEGMKGGIVRGWAKELASDRIVKLRDRERR